MASVRDELVGMRDIFMSLAYCMDGDELRECGLDLSLYGDELPEPVKDLLEKTADSLTACIVALYQPAPAVLEATKQEDGDG